MVEPFTLLAGLAVAAASCAIALIRRRSKQSKPVAVETRPAATTLSEVAQISNPTPKKSLRSVLGDLLARIGTIARHLSLRARRVGFCPPALPLLRVIERVDFPSVVVEWLSPYRKGEVLNRNSLPVAPSLP